jgi:hypothetical protein
MVTPLVISLWQHIPFPSLHAPTPQHSICVCIAFHQEPALVVHRGWSVSVALIAYSWVCSGYQTNYSLQPRFSNGAIQNNQHSLWHCTFLYMWQQGRHKTICKLCQYLIVMQCGNSLLMIFREKSASSHKLLWYEFLLSTSNTTLHSHLEKEHKEGYSLACDRYGWKNQLWLQLWSEAGVVASAGEGSQSHTQFSSKALLEH